MVFQGVPGAGKSALMLECMEAVRLHSNPQDPWVAARVSPRILNLPGDLMIAMVIATYQESQRLLAIDAQNSTSPLNRLLELGKGLLAEMSDRGFSLSGISVGGKSQDAGGSSPNLTADSAFRSMAPLLGEFRVVVFVDEAQNMPVDGVTFDVIDCLHGDTRGIPLVAAFFGLSDTKDVLRQCRAVEIVRRAHCKP